MSCHIPWCVATHAKPGTKHIHGGAAVSIGSSLTVRQMLHEWPGDLPDEPWVQLVYKVHGRERELYVYPQAAVDWSELLAGLDVRDLAAFSQALYRAGRNGGAHS
ncbi:unnamed protein product [[Actinomadura] parvosata subsp. kistnae]|uniref:Uncharacterized protein n=1 Tax=[Actinomadura] parvosata subsp. kistnae TaxID=1909395 RepID=A0A1V0ABS7_9ACTN|nr:hypothetical protein [Nonomuraea sp. ATCC 55076]AQZ67655.1 hypothetical protein BKM31_44865 [Nonomuraea sp. ATCC 55076]SPL94057.1 unnamed protein product [Actinomadura parvosata subsp. kistnae]